MCLRTQSGRERDGSLKHMTPAHQAGFKAWPSPLDGKSAVYSDRRPGDVAAAVPRQVGDDCGNVLGGAETAEGREAAQEAGGWSVSRVHVGVDETAMHHRGGDPARTQIAGQT